LKYDILFEPITIGSIEIKNRLVLAPTNTNFSNNHLVGDQSLAWYAARARGGLGLLIFEATPVSPMAARTSIYNIHHLWGPEHVAGMSLLTEAVHSFGAKIFIQLSPGLGVQGAMKGSGVRPKAPSKVSFRFEPENLPPKLIDWSARFPNMIPQTEGETPEELSRKEIEELIADFARACGKAVNAGFDGVEIHSPHGYLVHNFLSPRYNKRKDDYGGNLNNRMRFLLRLINRAKEVLGDRLVLGARLSIDEHNPDGIHFPEMKIVAQAAAAAGLDYLHVSDGCYEQAKYFLPAEDGTMLEGAAGFKEKIDIPVITPGLHDPDNAARAVLEGKTDMVSSSRAFIADPEWTEKVEQGQLERIRKCRRCNRCIYELFAGRPIRCTVNKKVGRERFELSKIVGVGVD
jgi:2,4-dienoyl-CoA reductase-like NADH-dependent reductase (Old Yellow Enzyme family)